MTGRTHDLAAFTSLVLVMVAIPQLPVMSLPTAVAAFGANFIGGLFPDIDQPTSDFWDNFRLGPLVAKIVCPAFGGHRHISHSVFGVALIAGLSHVLLGWLGAVVLINMDIVWTSFMIGVISHLFMDIFTKEGLPLFWPVLWKIGVPPIRALRIETGKWFEKLVVFPGLLLITGYVIYVNQAKFLDFLHQYLR